MYVCQSQSPFSLNPWDFLIPEAVRINVFFFELHGCKRDYMDRCDMSWCASDAGNTMIPFGLIGGKTWHKPCQPHCWSSTKNRWTLLISG